MASHENPSSSSSSSQSSSTNLEELPQFNTRVLPRRLKPYGERESRAPREAVNGTQNRNGEPPEHARFGTIEQFFNHKRAQLVKKVEEAGETKGRRSPKPFLQRIKPDTQGERVWPPPPGKPRRERSEETLAAMRMRKRGNANESWEDHPAWLMRRRHLRETWNQKITTMEQLGEQTMFWRFMKAQLDEYKLYRVNKVTGKEVRSWW